ncbi:MAG: uroporphyrinogen-III C-methyltransferase [Neisseria sp.]|uniref:uroporphyrinogen-III C-methyltransferase n=1 Tax=Neisseria sp. TaxID=192066 RepID=UPI0026DD2986|nr:uroporphyrinogen-III C-methyltransferase [Neisseria sp.]MDO4641145.1 uroporphyrinogen-III C-methyltransferase [Neisseria sp.]
MSEENHKNEPVQEHDSAQTEQQPQNTGSHMSSPKNEENRSGASAQPTPIIVKQSGGKVLATGALVLALLGLGASGFLFVQGQNVLKNQELNVAQKLDKAALGESQNANVLQETLRRQETISEALAKLDSGNKQNAEAIANAQRAYQELLKGRVNWLVDETEVTLNVAAQQLQLTGNVPVAVQVLSSVDSRLSHFDQPELLPIKQAISSDLAALKNRPYLDVSSASLRLDRLESAVASLPLVLEGTLQPGEAAPAAVPDGQLSWWENAWNKTLDSLKGLVEVRTLNSNDAMLISPEQNFFIKENLRLRLMDARFALMQRNGEVYQTDLNTAEAAVGQYFDGHSQVTQAWLKELAELKGLDVRAISDDALKASLQAVRNYQDSVRAGQPAVTIPATPPAAASAPASAAASQAPASAASAPKAEAASAAKPEAASSVKGSDNPKADNPAASQPSGNGKVEKGARA